MTDSNRKFLVFTLQSSLYALDLAHVAEVSDPPQLCPIPRAPSCYSGALNYHGDIVAVMNLSAFLEIPGCNLPEKLIVLHHEVASLAFLVDSVVRIIAETEVSFGPTPENGFAAALLNFSDGKATLLDLEALVISAGICMQGSLPATNNFFTV